MMMMTTTRRGRAVTMASSLAMGGEGGMMPRAGEGVVGGVGEVAHAVGVGVLVAAVGVEAQSLEAVGAGGDAGGSS